LTLAAGFLLEHNPSNGTSQQRKKVNRPTCFHNQPSPFTAWRLFVLREIRKCNASPLFEIALVLVRLDHVASMIVHSNDGVMLH
jgi:hypothetical protein